MNPRGPALDVIGRRAALSGDRPAVLWRGAWLTYRELDARAARLAGRLAAAGVRPGERVSILARNHLAHLELMLAAPKHGFVHAPLNPRLAPAEQRALGSYLRPALVLFDQEHAEGARAAAQGAGGAPTVALEGWDDWIGDLPAPPAPDLDAESPHMILLTGGTTGLPKGAVQPYRQGLWNAANTVLSWGLRDDDAAVQATPCFHAAVNALSAPLLHLGGRVVLQERFDPAGYLRLVREGGATLLFLVPTMYAMLREHPDFASADLSGVRWAISGGAPCPAPVREAFEAKGVRFRQGYGLTEAGVNLFAFDPDEAERHPDSVGRPVLYGRAEILRGDGSACAPGEVGELTVSGPHVFSGYFERPDATLEAMPDGRLRTGDLASADEAGRVTIRGRRKEMFISGGENVFPAEIEAALHEHPDVAECAVAGVPDERWGEVGAAFVAPRPGAALEPAALRAFLRGRLAGYKVPKHVTVLPELPKSGAGKILKRDLVASLTPDGRAGKETA